MNWFYKLERKFSKYAIRNLMYYIIIMYGLGILIDIVNPLFYAQYLSLDARAIYNGQIWRVVTFLLQPPSSGIIGNIFMLFICYMLGLNLERAWGSFRFNLYFLSGVIGHVIVAIVGYQLSGNVWLFGMTYLNMSLFFCFAAVYPDWEFMLFFVMFPIKAKWLALIYGINFLYTIVFMTGAARVSAIVSLINFLCFFLIIRDNKKFSPKKIKNKVVFKTQMNVAKMNVLTGARHKCSVCNRTEKDEANLDFRYCTKCNGNYEYCQDHLYVHKHVE
jgi:hypothetical protein